MGKTFATAAIVITSAFAILASPVASAERLHGEYDDLYYIFDPKHKREVGRSIRHWPGEYEYCMRKTAREEYETRDEYEARKKEVVRECASYWPLKDAVVRIGGELLTYDADRETFSFNVDLGPIGFPTKRRGIVTKEDEREWCERRIHCGQGGKYYSNIICWVADLDKHSSEVNDNYLDADLRVKAHLDSASRGGNNSLFDICFSGGEDRIQVLVKAGIAKARSLKKIEDRLHLELTGNSSYFKKISGPITRRFFVFHITGISLVDTKSATSVFSFGGSN